MTIEEINEAIAKLPNGEDKGVSDGHHTFGELYEHRCVLYIALFRVIRRKQYNQKDTKKDWISIRASKLHSDGTMFDGRFIAGIVSEGKQISYHLPIKYREEITKHCHILDKGLERDGYTSQDVIDRLLSI